MKIDLKQVSSKMIRKCGLANEDNTFFDEGQSEKTFLFGLYLKV